MARVLLLDLPVSSLEKFGNLSKFASKFPPLNLILLGTLVKKRGHSVKISCDDQTYDDIHTTLVDFKPSIVGITCATMLYPYLAKCIEFIKDFDKEIIVVLGGVHPSLFPEDVMEDNPDVFASFIGEADNTFPDFVDIVSENPDDINKIKTIPNIIFRTNSGELITTDSSPGKIEMDDLPFLDYGLIPDIFTRFYPAFYRHFLPSPNILVTVTRGCPFKCVFCCRKITGSKIRYNSLDYRINLLKHLKNNHGIKGVIYGDELLTFKKNDMAEFSERILAEGLDDIKWICASRVDTIDEKIAELMYKAGCRQVAFGIETGSEQILDLLKKGASVDKAYQALSACRKNKIITYSGFILGCFGETHETMKATHNFIMTSGIDYIGVTNFTPMPGSESFETWKEYGTLRTDDLRDYNTFSGVPFLPHGLTKEDIEYWRNKIYKDFYYRPAFFLKHYKFMFNKYSWKYLAGVLTR